MYPSKGASGGYNVISAPIVVVPQSPALYHHDRIMKDAFEAASFAGYEDFNVGATYTDAPYNWNSGVDYDHSPSPAIQGSLWY